jgi:hypothetical protein
MSGFVCKKPGILRPRIPAPKHAFQVALEAALAGYVVQVGEQGYVASRTVEGVFAPAGILAVAPRGLGVVASHRLRVGIAPGAKPLERSSESHPPTLATVGRPVKAGD